MRLFCYKLQMQEIGQNPNHSPTEIHDIIKIKNILKLPKENYPNFFTVKNKKRFENKLNDYNNKVEKLKILHENDIMKILLSEKKLLNKIRPIKNDMIFELEEERIDMIPRTRKKLEERIRFLILEEKMIVNFIKIIKEKYIK